METGNEWRLRVAELLREAFIASLDPDVVLLSSVMEGFSDSAVISVGKLDSATPVAAVLYDLIPLTNPKAYLDPYPVFQAFYSSRVEQLKNTKRLLAISEFCAQEGREKLTGYAGEIASISSAIEDDFKPPADYPGEAADFADRMGIARPYVLYTGGADDRKNLPALMRAFAELPADLRNSHQLVFAGKLHAQEVRQVQRAARAARLKPGELLLTGYISDRDLKQLYANCEVYAFPSWHEGFGLPALEAMACGAPVIGARSSSLVEVIGLDEALFDPFDDSDICALLQRSLEDQAYRDRLRAHGREQVKKFSWQNTARAAWRLILDIHARSPVAAHGTLCQERLIAAIGQLPGNNTPENLELARIADCIDRNMREIESESSQA
jgi:glycosyltransferase involved in cell wall biosynthesis